MSTTFLANNESLEVNGQAFISNTNIQNLPSDPLFNQQWHLLNSEPGLLDLNVVDVWEDYTGKGVEVAVIDDAVQWWHPDLIDNYSTFKDWDFENNDTDSGGVDGENHGTAVAGIISASADNNIGGVGIAYHSSLFGFQVNGHSIDESLIQQLTAAITYASGQNQDGYEGEADIINLSYGTAKGPNFFDSFLSHENMTALNEAIDNASILGREGLGTILVKSAGNSRQEDYNQNTNSESWNANPHTISVAAVDQDGYVSDYSTPGASVLVSAFGTPWEVVTTDRVGEEGYNIVDEAGNVYASDFTNSFSGTSAAAPMVSGVVALMLEANPDLGWRDVQEILAYSARQVGSPVEIPSSDWGSGVWLSNTSDDWTTNVSEVEHHEKYDWTFNGANNWNGGGLHFSNDYGFGLVDAKAAVRLAETWGETPQTSHNAVSLTSDFLDGSTWLNDWGTYSNRFINNSLDIEHVEVDVSFTDWFDLGDLEIRLISPNSTSSVLINDSGENNESPEGGFGAGNWQFFSNAFRGEDAFGEWQVQLFDADNNWTSPIIVDDINITFHGQAASWDDTLIFTNEYSDYAHGGFGHSTVIDGGLGTDTLNAAAVDSDTVIDLATGTGQIDGVAVGIANVEKVITGDGNDVIVGDGFDNTLRGMRGDDVLVGGAGSDWLDGGKGNDFLNGTNPGVWNAGQGEYDVLTGGLGADVFALGDEFEAFYAGLGYALITDFNWGEGDVFQMHGSIADYSLGLDNWAGGMEQDTLIYYQNDVIGVVQDITNIDPVVDFVFA